MKILMPFKKLNGVSIHSEKIVGGIENFAKSLFKYIPGIIPLEFEENEQTQQLSRKIAYEAKRLNVDLVLSNYDNSKLVTYSLQNMINTPILLISHNLANTAFKLKILKLVPEFITNGGSLVFVSNYQLNTWKKMNSKVNPGYELRSSGFISPAFCSGNEYYSLNKNIDIITVGRCNKAKDPFSVLRKLDKIEHSLNCTVITTKYREAKNQEYLDDNTKYFEDNTVLWNLPHEDVLNKISSARVLVSTGCEESYGITAHEALSHGVPVILFTLADRNHASLDIPAYSDHVIALKKSCSPAEFVEAVQYFMDKPKEFTQEIFSSTQKKHAQEKWVKNILDICGKAVYDYHIMKMNDKSSLESFM